MSFADSGVRCTVKLYEIIFFRLYSYQGRCNNKKVRIKFVPDMKKTSCVLASIQETVRTAKISPFFPRCYIEKTCWPVIVSSNRYISKNLFYILCSLRFIYALNTLKTGFFTLKLFFFFVFQGTFCQI